MTSGFNAYSLALFTTLAPAGVIAFIILALIRLKADSHETAVRIDRIIALPFSVVLIGFIASATHLGTPANALHVFAGVGRSPLSNEVLAAICFLFLVESYWIVAFRQHFPDIIAKPWLVLSCLSGVALIVLTSLAYSAPTVPTWDTPYTPANLILSALLAGSVLGILFLEITYTHPHNMEVFLLITACTALVAGTIVLIMQSKSLATITNNEFCAISLALHYPFIIAIHLLLGLIGVTVTGFSLRLNKRPRSALILRIVACILVLIAVFITRMEFYNLHMTIGF